ncbi:hypothetical protein ACWEN3_39520 [Streptomyces sp. NPDC004561]
MGTQEPDSGRPARDAEGLSVPDEVWEKFSRDHEIEIRAGAPMEPSDRARMVTARLRQQDARAAAQQGGPWQPDVIKVRGRVPFERGARASVVHAENTFVYPVTHAEGDPTEVQRTIVRRPLDTEPLGPTQYQGHSRQVGSLTLRRGQREQRLRGL